MHEQSNELFDELERDDWLQAFAAHAAIGSPRPGDRQGAGEQAAVAGAGRRTARRAQRRQLSAANAAAAQREITELRLSELLDQR